MSTIPYDHGAGRRKRVAGICIGVFTALLLVGLVQDISLAGVLLVALFGVGAWLLYAAGARDAAIARRAALAQMQLRVLEMAREDGRLTVTEVATRLGWTLPAAAAVLESLDDGHRVYATPSSEGVMVYEFRELIHDPDRPQLRDPTQPPPIPQLRDPSQPPPIPQSAPGRPR